MGLIKIITCKDSTKIANPSTGRCVLKTGRIGQALIQQNEKFNQQINGKKEVHFKYQCYKKRGMLQETGTCWFNAIFNMFLLSENFYSHFLNQYRKLSKKTKALIEADGATLYDSCPMKLQKDHFMRYFYKYSENLEYAYIMEEHRPVFDRGALAVKMINDMKFRSPEWEKRKYNNYLAMDKILPIIFKHAEYAVVDQYQTTRRKPNFLILRYFHQNDGLYHHYTYKFNNITYIIDSAIVVVITIDKATNTNTGHVMSGYRCNKELYMYDSNSLKTKKMDWREVDIVKRYFKAKYGKQYKITGVYLSHVFYIKT